MYIQLISHKKEQMWISWTEVDELRACYTEWSKSEREKYINVYIYIWNWDKRYWWTYLQGRDGNTDPEKGLVDKAGGRSGGMNWERSIEIYTVLGVKQTASGKLLCIREPSLALGDGLAGWDESRAGRGAQEEGDAYIFSSDWFALLFGRNQHDVYSNYPPIKKIIILKKR